MHVNRVSALVWEACVASVGGLCDERGRPVWRVWGACVASVVGLCLRSSGQKQQVAWHMVWRGVAWCGICCGVV
eukprot:364656-Chlamydomonas_euryale.AAC.6